MSINDLKGLADDLNVARDNVTGKLKEWEAALEKLNLGVEASVTTDYGALSYGRHNGRWRILFGARPALESSIAERVVALDYIENLVKAIETAAREQLARMKA